MRSRTTDDVETDWSHARDELRRAYLLVQFGHLDRAIAICREVDEFVRGGHHLPGTLEGAFLIAQGSMRRARRRLRSVISEFSDAVLPRLYFAEACYLDGRREQGDRALDEVREMDRVAHPEFLEYLENTFGGGRDGEVPPPVRVRGAQNVS